MVKNVLENTHEHRKTHVEKQLLEHDIHLI